VLKVTAPPYLYSGPSPIASLASALVGLQVNATRGDQLRARIHAGARRILDHLAGMGVATRNVLAFPVVEVPLADPDDLDLAGRFLFDHGMYVTLAFYPGVPHDEVGFRLQVTAANTDDEVDELLGSWTCWPTPSRCGAQPATPSRRPPDAAGPPRPRLRRDLR
jgi:7-keto-8-aminopelargonate synthetase-like enzyme